MKRLLLFAAFVATAFCAKAQTNIQEQYDFNREHLTTTLEMFQPDNWGSTFFFTDIYHPNNTNGPTGYYTEIARGLNFWQNTKAGNLSAHVEWNGGQFANNAWLFGAEYLFHSKDYRYTLTCEVLYKTIAKAKQEVPLQFTIVWGISDLFGAKGLTFSGFADFWWETLQWAPILDANGVQEIDANGNPKFEETTCVFISEPQLWYCVGQFFNCPNLHVGGEVEFAYNFAGAWRKEYVDNKGFNVSPCLGLKWIF